MSRPSTTAEKPAITFRETQAPVVEADLDGRITYANDACLRACGFSEQELLGRPFNRLSHSEMPACVYGEALRKLRLGEEVHAYVVSRARHGEAAWELAHFTPRYDANGRVTGYRALHRPAAVEEVTQIEPFYRKIRKLEMAVPAVSQS